MPKTTILESIRDDLISWHVIRSEREFCEQWLGMSECYMRTLRHRKLDPSTRALATLSSKLGYHADELERNQQPDHLRQASQMRHAQRQLDAAIARMSLARWQERQAT